MYQKQLHSEEATRQFAEKLSHYLEPGMTILLEGDLGAGKTTFTKGVAAGLEIDRIIKSPTYTIIREYTSGRLPLYHMDLYRLEDSGVEGLGLEEYFSGEGVSIVEWPTVAMEDMPADHLHITLAHGENPDSRQMTITAMGHQYTQLLAQLEALDS